jgi:hypothetical protein
LGILCRGRYRLCKETAVTGYKRRNDLPGCDMIPPFHPHSPIKVHTSRFEMRVSKDMSIKFRKACYWQGYSAADVIRKHMKLKIDAWERAGMPSRTA